MRQSSRNHRFREPPPSPVAVGVIAIAGLALVAWLGASLSDAAQAPFKRLGKALEEPAATGAIVGRPAR